MSIPPWASILRKNTSEWEKSLKSSKAGSKILIPTSVGGYLPG